MPHKGNSIGVPLLKWGTTLPFPPNPLKHVLCNVPNCGVDALSQLWQCLWKWWDVNIVLDETPKEENMVLQNPPIIFAKSSDNLYAPCTLSLRYRRANFLVFGKFFTVIRNLFPLSWYGLLGNSHLLNLRTSNTKFHKNRSTIMEITGHRVG